MQISENNAKLNIPSLIQMIQAKSPDNTSNKQPKFFPYIETYGNKHEGEENMLMNKTIKFRESYIHNRTLRYLEPTFSYRQVLAKLKNEIMYTGKPDKRQKIKTIENTHKLKDIIYKTELFMAKDIEPLPKTVQHRKAKSQFPNGVTKMKKTMHPLQRYSGMSPDILKVTNFVQNGVGKKKFGASVDKTSERWRRQMENLTFYQETSNTIQDDGNIMDNAYTRGKYPLTATVIVKDPKRKLTCDAVSNTDLSM
jgi:hypothetical protein